MAVIGESGAGKSTLRRDLTERINRENAPVIVIEPYIIAMEDNDVERENPEGSSDCRSHYQYHRTTGKHQTQSDAPRQLHRVLKDSSQAGFSHVLVIEEAQSAHSDTETPSNAFLSWESGFKTAVHRADWPAGTGDKTV